MKRAKRKATESRHGKRLTPKHGAELEHARHISTDGPMPGLKAFFRKHLSAELMTIDQQ